MCIFTILGLYKGDKSEKVKEKVLYFGTFQNIATPNKVRFLVVEVKYRKTLYCKYYIFVLL